MSQAVLYEQDAAIVTLTLHRPATRNALTDMEMIDALAARLSCAQADARVRVRVRVRVIVRTGAGPAFSSGGNIEHMRDALGLLQAIAENPPASCACPNGPCGKGSGWTCPACWNRQPHFKALRTARQTTVRRSPRRFKNARRCVPET